MTLPAQKPMVLPIRPENIPALLKHRKQWTIWRAVPKPDGRISKEPISSKTGRNVNALDPLNWLSFDHAVAAYQSGKADGIGFALNGEPVVSDAAGRPLYLVGVDLDKVNDNSERAGELLGLIRGAYLEYSPSGKGLRIFCLSSHKPRSGQGNGGELYVQGRFLTVTGQEARGIIRDHTDGVRALEQMLWPAKSPTQANIVEFPSHIFDVNRRIAGGEWIETPENLDSVKRALAHIPPDCSYETWRSVVWSVASLDWSCGAALVEKWSSGSAAHWDHDNGDKVRHIINELFERYDSSREITIGTLFHHAYENGMPRPELSNRHLFAVPSAPSADNLLLSRNDLDALPPLRWTVRSVLPETGIAAIYGDPGSGKSFLAIDLAAKVSSGLPAWFGRDIVERDVVYVALEGGRGIQQRITAWEAANQRRADNAKFWLSDFALLSEEDVTQLVTAVTASCKPGAVVIIDTLAQATAGADENSAQDMGLALKAAQAISAAVSGLVLLVHHSGKDKGKGLRGHSALNGAMDAVIAVERDHQTGLSSWRVTKMKDADDSARGQFELEFVNLGVDEFGASITSGAVREITAFGCAFNGKPAVPKGRHQKAVLDALQAHTDGDEGWTQAELEAIAKDALGGVATQHRATRAKSAIDGLIAGGHINEDEGGVFHLTLSPDHPPPAPL